MNKYFVWFSGFCVLTYLVFGIQWSNSWERTKYCFAPITLSVPELFPFNQESLWTQEAQEGINYRGWNLPYLLMFSEPRSEEQLSNLGISGYLIDGRFLELGAIQLNRTTVVTLNGNVLIHRSGLFSWFFNQISVIASVEAEVEGKNYVVYGFSLADNIKETLTTSRCYESDDNT
jgi:hypothetical protein